MQIEVTECLLSLGAESFVCSVLTQELKIKAYRTTVFLLFCKGVQLGKNKIKPPAPTVSAL
jgi:hypothetical protein